MVEKVALLALALILGAGGVQAQTFEGSVALSYGTAPFLSTDDDSERLTESGYKASGYLGATFGDWRIFGDLNLYNRSIGDQDFDEYAPGGAGSLGLHAGRNFGAFYGGAFVGKNRFQGSDVTTTNDYMTGSLYGIEGEYSMGAVSVFAQVGRAKMIGDPGDSEFSGSFSKIGIAATVDRFVISAEFEKGNSPLIFEDDGDSGDYRAISVGVDYQITDRVIGTLTYETMDIIANTEDSGLDEFFGIGIRIPFGATGAKRNNLTTSYRPGLAAAWAETLD